MVRLPDFQADQDHADDQPSQQAGGDEAFKIDRHVDGSGQRPGSQAEGAGTFGIVAR